MAFPHDGNKFQPGQSGNPNGRPKGTPNTKTRLMRWLEIETTVKNPVTQQPEPATVLEMMDAVIIKKALKGDLKAYQEIIDRLEGKSTQKNEGDVIVRHDLKNLSNDDLLQLLKIKDKLSDGE